ncbi:SUMO-activating enzyme subunit 2-like [Dendronephthya gigantea]|uniref:SUMO-activating enzyme subunit 2-like n=1 Tax=Dendronephthya gigantea TaxID=151771 RepID=UPI00106C93E2|nr:SUMO-activating enzyme subunit 2-like [Dendronephthya gigantea]
MAKFGEIQGGNLGEDLYKNLEKCRVLVVGAGGIGCELLKTLVLTGFNDIEVIDLDTIDVSNLNRQFLFQKQHVGKSKAKVARESAIEFNPQAKIKAYHDSIMSPDYDVNFFQRFSVVLNALDNRAARNHVNRMCLAAGVPLVESGTAGYLGQVTVIQKSKTECYECQPKPHQKTYPGCTIRNTPSEPIHCIVWAKHLFNQLFGEADADEEVSPDAEDPEAVGDAGAVANDSSKDDIQRVSTQDWAKSIEYESARLIQKFFIEDIKYLLSMDKLWKERKAPIPLDIENLHENSLPDNENGLPDQKIWTIRECVEKFKGCVDQLKEELIRKGDFLVWDKDDNASLDFVVSACNIRAHIFDIQQKSRFDVKSMAGNIIPAIATTNAIISGLIVLEALKALQGDIGKCRTIYLNKKPSVRKKLLQPSPLVAPNPKCYVCSTKPEAKVMLDCAKVTLKALEEKLLKQEFGVIAPDVEIEDGKGTILISSEEGETDENNSKMLADFGVTNGSRLKIDDFHQNYELVLNIVNCSNMADDEEFKILQDVEKMDDDSTNNEEANDVIVSGDINEITMDANEQGIEIAKEKRKRKASDSLSGDPEIAPKHARIDLTNDNELPGDVSKQQFSFHENGSLVSEESEGRWEPGTVIDVDALSGSESDDLGSEPAVMVIDDDDKDDESEDGKLKISGDKNGEREEPVVVVLDDD